MIQTAQDLFRITLANSAAFRSWAGVSTVNDALLRIHHDYWPEPTADTYTLDEIKAIWPAALVFTQPDRGFVYERDASATSDWAARGELVCVLQQSYPLDANDNPNQARKEADVDFRDITGDILGDLVEMSETADRLAIVGLTVSGPFRTAPDENTEAGDQLVMEIVARWSNR